MSRATLNAATAWLKPLSSMSPRGLEEGAIFRRSAHPLGHPDLAGPGLRPEARRDVCDSPNGAVVEAPFEPNLPQGGVVRRDAHAEAQSVAATLPLRGQLGGSVRIATAMRTA